MAPSSHNLAEVNCQVSELMVVDGERWERIERTPLPNDYIGEKDQVVDIHIVEFTEFALTYQGVSCKVIKFANEAAAQRAFASACSQVPGDTKLPTIEIGDEACNLLESKGRVVFRRGEFLVVTGGDKMNRGVALTMAQAVDQRLK